MQKVDTTGLIFSMKGSPFQGKLIEAGESGVVFYYKIPDDYVGFIYELANSRHPRTYLGWEIDHYPIEALEREIAPLDRPKQIYPPIVVENEIKFTAYNEDTQDLWFGVFCDGILHLRRDLIG